MLCLGVDLAQARDRTALVAVSTFRPEAADEPDATAEPGQKPRRPKRPLHHEIVHVSRLSPGLSYPRQVELIIATAHGLVGEERPVIIADGTGVGKAVVDLLREDCPFALRSVVITGGSETVKSGPSDWSVPKSELVGGLEIALSGRRLHAVPGLSLAAELDKEMRSFGFDLGPTGRPKWEARSGHDDLVISLALALWGAERGRPAGAVFAEYMESEIARRQAQPA